ncbi:hypothetical protein [Sulfobacillus thermosulfidooxidans]|uniref:hypothetical protein n=1 Tax=Sulfobacillus thermosulfidooxidans TaxID=28034 RepID=UPI000373A328|nr:hypothetical protein [Sulfobacillus thermosulfidooxidans]
MNAGLRELKDNGYIPEVVVRNERGQIIKHEYVVFEAPETDFPDLDNASLPDLPDLAKPDTANPPLLIKKETNKENTHTQQ